VQKDSNHPGFTKLFTERNWRIVDVLLEVAKSVKKTPALVALNWVVYRPGITTDPAIISRHV
jgi:aryl-alcohol dehydrogenase-like predicted oxidoreductase